MNALISRLLTQPSVLYRKDPLFYFKYDSGYFALLIGLFGALWVSDAVPLVPEWRPAYWLSLPVALYLHILANVCVHNCCHGNFPRSINRLVGELLGLIVLTRYASWEIVHTRHHRYSDDVEKDPHYVLPNFWKFTANIAVNVEVQLQHMAYDQFGDTPAVRRRERVRALLSFVTMLPLLGCWYLLLGTEAFFYIYLPVTVVGWLHVAHFNWATHNAHDPSGDYHPVNLDHGWYWLGNRIWFGLYMHGNHHRRANVFNPLRMDEVVAKRKAARAQERPDAAA
ncbi:MAG: fatty acid desaturase [Myxococcales bacterium]|nr:fatty acid desaturase [Myxococcales bacterium]